jgi:hypothetical protein
MIPILLTIILLLLPIHVLCSDTNDASSATESSQYDYMAPAFDHLMAVTQKNSDVIFDTGQIDTILDFVNTKKDLKDALSLGTRQGSSSDYYEFTIKRSLKEVLDLVYSPDIPSYFTVPSSVRRSHWIEVDGKQQPFPKLSDKLEHLAEPVVIKGLEFNEITPDSQSGAYYAYNLDRALILMQHRGNHVLISTSSQPDKSNVGKKGLVLGSDDDWNYLYTGVKGVMMPGLGWADSYMYSSASIMIYYEVTEPVPAVRCCVFKWLHAGWAGMNLAQSHHIRTGVVRFAKSFKEVLESPALGDLSKISAVLHKIDNLPIEDLREQSRFYYEDLKNRYENKSRRNKKWFKKLFSDEEYLKSMSRNEMTAIVSIEYLKFLLGKKSRFDVTYFSPLPVRTKRPG